MVQKELENKRLHLKYKVTHWYVGVPRTPRIERNNLLNFNLFNGNHRQFDIQTHLFL